MQTNYSGQNIKKMEIDKNEHEIELSNGLDITFNKRFQVIDID